MDVERALGLLALVGEKEITVKEAVELIELVTRTRVKEVLQAAEEQGLIKRQKRYITINGGEGVETPKIKKAPCEASCSRCGRPITSCYYISFFDDEIGPFGSACIRKLRLG